MAIRGTVTYNLQKRAQEKSRSYTPSYAALLVQDVVRAHLRDGRCVDLRGRVLAVEQGGGLLERQTLCLDDEEVQEHELERDPADVYNLQEQSQWCKRSVMGPDVRSISS